MFTKDIYIRRRQTLLAKMAEVTKEGNRGLVIFLGNNEAPQNYRGNNYKFRQESNYLYFWGLDEPSLAAIMDLDSGKECIYGDDVDIDDIIWMGPQISMAEKAASVGCKQSAPFATFAQVIKNALAQHRPVHFLPACRYYNILTLSQITGIPASEITHVAPMNTLGGMHASEELVKSIISMRLVKESCEIEEIDKACDLGYIMHTTARKNCKVGMREQQIVGRMEGAALEHGWGVSFATICSQNGETLHNPYHHQIITPGRLLLIDAGVESNSHYCSDNTRTYPCSGKFTQMQKEIYDLVEGANENAFNLASPGKTYWDVHYATARYLIEGLKDLDLVRGDVDEMTAAGVSGLFMPHGLGHNMGLDVHDMEDFGEDYVGYADDQVRSPLLGLGNLRMARRLVPGNVITDEPGLYFIPALIQKWKEEGTGKDWVNYSKLEKYYDFGGIRLEDDLLITTEGCRRLGSERIPIKSSEIEELMANE